MAIFLKIIGREIKGEGSAKGFEGAISISSFQFGAGIGVHTTMGSTTNRVAGQASLSEITLTKNLDETSPSIFSALCQGESFPKMSIHFLIAIGKDDTGNNEYLTYNLENVIFSGWSQSSGGDRPQESISLNFSKITMLYKTEVEAGKLEGKAPIVSWNITTNATA